MGTVLSGVVKEMTFSGLRSSRASQDGGQVIEPSEVRPLILTLPGWLEPVRLRCRS